MQLTDKDIDVIDAFIFESISSEDKIYFEQRLADKEFSDYLAQQKRILNTIEEKGDRQTKLRLQAIESSITSNRKNLPQHKSPSSLLNRRTLLAVAAIIVLVLSMIYIPKLLADSQSQTLYANNYTPYPNLIAPITKSTNQNKSPYQYYESKQYDIAIEKLSKLPNSNDRNWYLAQSYMAIGEVAKAKELLHSFNNESINEYSQAAQWYLALLLVKDNQIEAAKGSLSKIAASAEHPYAAGAKNLLKDL